MCADLAKQLDVLGSESVVAAARQIERAESTAAGDERNAADRLDAFIAEHGDDFARIPFEFRAAREKRQSGGDGVPSGRCIARHGDFAFEHTGAAGKIESMDFQQAGDGIKEREAGVVVVNDALERGNDAAKNFGDLAADHENVVDLQKHAQAVALAGELRLVSLRILKIKRVIDGYGDLAGDALHKLQLGVRDALGNHAAKPHRADAALRRGERKDGHRMDAVFANPRYEVREARFFVDIGDDERLLSLPNPAGRMAFDG